MNTTQIIEAIKEALAVLEAQHNAKTAQGKTIKSSRGKARAAANNIKKLAAEYKKTSSAEDKAE